MQSSAYKNRENKNHAAVAGRKNARNRNAALQLLVKQPEALQMQRWQELSNNSPQSQRLTQYQKLANKHDASQVWVRQNKQGNNALTQPLPHHAQQTPTGEGVVQRAVGFEFESGWLVWEKVPHEEEAEDTLKPLKKKDLVHEGNGFKVEADEAGSDLAELEFIIHPPLEATDMGIAKAYKKVIGMTLFGAKLLSGLGPTTFDLGEVTGKEADNKFVIKPVDSELGTRPQVTAGIALEDIPKLANDEAQALPEQLDKTHSSATTFVNATKELEDYMPGDLPMDEKLRGLFTLLSSYLSYGNSSAIYAKQITDSFLLARTDFAKMFKLLPKETQAYFKKNTNMFVSLAMKAADLDDREAPVIKKVWGSDENVGVKAPYSVGPSREKWLYMIVQGYDLMSVALLKEFQTEHSHDVPELESMGELGGKTESVGASGREGAILELRSAALKGKEGIVPMIGWWPFVRGVLNYFTLLDADSADQ